MASGPAIAQRKLWLRSSSSDPMLGWLAVAIKSTDLVHLLKQKRTPLQWLRALTATMSSEAQSLTSMDYKRVCSIPTKARAMTRYSAKQRRMRGIGGRSKRKFLQLYTNVKRSRAYHSLSPYAR